MPDLINNPAQRLPMSEETREFLADWLAWVERGAPEHQPYRRYWGLCSNASVFEEGGGISLAEVFREFGAHPFGAENYEARAAYSTQHLDPLRLAFVRANLP